MLVSGRVSADHRNCIPVVFHQDHIGIRELQALLLKLCLLAKASGRPEIINRVIGWTQESSWRFLGDVSKTELVVRRHHSGNTWMLIRRVFLFLIALSDCWIRGGCLFVVFYFSVAHGQSNGSCGVHLLMFASLAMWNLDYLHYHARTISAANDKQIWMFFIEYS